jgi:membrane protein implicated in regulation of membrane protease activity
MTVVAVVLIILAALVVLGAMLGGSGSPVELTLGGIDVSMTATSVFLLGVATALVFASGLELLRVGLGRSLSRRRELQQARAVMAEHERRERMQAQADPDSGTTDTGTTDTTGTGKGGDTRTGTGRGAHRAPRGDPTLPGKPAGTDPDTPEPSR